MPVKKIIRKTGAETSIRRQVEAKRKLGWTDDMLKSYEKGLRQVANPKPSDMPV